MVAGWISPISEHEETLETLFVKLTAAPTPIKLEGLPENVVPLSHLSKRVKCKLPNGMLLEILRDQVPVVPNFAMTDFASQGRTRPYNVCDLQNCKTHQSAYTCLSRGSTLKGTIIVQPFDSGKLTGGIAGSLRQEFRELELLDEITKMRYLGTIPPKVLGITRNELIHSFRQWKGESFVPNTIHDALKWSSNDPFPIEPVTEDAPWTILKPSKEQPKDQSVKTNNNDVNVKSMTRDRIAFVPAQGSHALQSVSNVSKSAKKRKCVDEMTECEIQSRAKRIRVGKAPEGKVFVGFPWDQQNYSCAYDSLLTCLLALYTETQDIWKSTVATQSRTLTDIGQLFHNTLPKVRTMSLTQARDFLRNMLGARNSELKAKGTQFTDLYTLVREVIKVEMPVIQRCYICRACDYKSEPELRHRVVWSCDVDFWKANPARLGIHKGKSVTQWINALSLQKTANVCPSCTTAMLKSESYIAAPPIIAFLTPDKAVIETQIVWPGINQVYRLCSIIYYHQSHFVCRFIDKSGGVWFHDGAINKSEVLYYDNIVNWTPKKLQTAGEASMSVLLYSKF